MTVDDLSFKEALCQLTSRAATTDVGRGASKDARELDDKQPARTAVVLLRGWNELEAIAAAIAAVELITEVDEVLCRVVIQSGAAPPGADMRVTVLWVTTDSRIDVLCCRLTAPCRPLRTDS